jgi:predicted DNA-binding WGR domain protein
MRKQWIYLECTVGAKRRFYRVMRHPGLFGPTLIRDWGRIGTMGRTKTDIFQDDDEQEKAWDQLLHMKEHRGYRRVATG